MSYSEIAAAILFGVLVLLLILFTLWNTVIRGRKVHRVADRDEEYVDSEKIFLRDAQKVVGPYISVMSGLTGLTFAGTFVVIALVLAVFDLAEFNPFRAAILYAILGLSGASAIIWLLALDQLTIMASPSVTKNMFFRFYRYIVDLWFLGYVLIILALMLFLKWTRKTGQVAKRESCS
jgi:hypothetical protein